MTDLRAILFLWRHWKEIDPSIRKAIRLEMGRLLRQQKRKQK